MKHTAIICAIAAASLGFASGAFAQHNEHNNGPDELLRNRPGNATPAQGQDRYNDVRRRDERQDRYNDARRRDDRQDRYYDARRRDERQDFREGQHNDRRDYYSNARSPEFRRGGYIPREYRQRQYVVVQYHDHHLARPPRGHEWVQVGTDYVLIAIATGLIAQIVLSQ